MKFINNKHTKAWQSPVAQKFNRISTAILIQKLNSYNLAQNIYCFLHNSACYKFLHCSSFFVISYMNLCTYVWQTHISWGALLLRCCNFCLERVTLRMELFFTTYQVSFKHQEGGKRHPITHQSTLLGPTHRNTTVIHSYQPDTTLLNQCCKFCVEKWVHNSYTFEAINHYYFSTNVATFVSVLPSNLKARLAVARFLTPLTYLFASTRLGWR